MFKRIFQMPKKSFFLLGPRGTGKSTWFRTQTFDLVIDLLKSRTRLELERNPSHLHALTAPIASGGWVLIDEVQKIPALLDEVHSIYEERGINFALTGSSARKLKRSGVNLLAGRALNFSFFPLVYPEYGDAIPLMDRVEWGTLPLVVDQMEHRADTLETYVDNYLRQELVEEGIVRNLEPFTRFLQVAALMNAQILNVENIARDAQVKRPTVDKYFEVLIDTLIGYRLPAYQPGLKTKEVAHPKFYFFDPGVARAAAGLVREPLDRSQLGFQLETFILNEVRAYNEYSRRKRDLYHYALSGGRDIDLIIQLEKKTTSKSDRVVAIEFKLKNKWDSGWTKQLEEFRAWKGASSVEKLIGVYTGEQRLKIGNVEVFPVDGFLKALHSGEIY